MISFRQKEFSEYDAMRSLYVELMKRSDRSKFGIIDLSSLIPILKGNNVVIEKFVISTSILGKDKYRMYLKVGNKAKMPDEIRLPQRVYDKRLGNMQVNLNGSLFENNIKGGDYQQENDNNTSTNIVQQNNQQNQNNQSLNTEEPKNDDIRSNRKKKKIRFKKKGFSEIVIEKSFADNKKKNPPPFLSASYSPSIDISHEVKELLGEAIKYDKKERSLVLEFSSINDAISALNILPFGLGYKIYLLNP